MSARSVKPLRNFGHKNCALCEQAKRESPWRAIDTAPLDGAPVIVAVDCRRHGPNAWVVGEARACGENGKEGWYWAGNDPTDVWGGQIHPELWQPMPEAPL